MTTAFAGFNAMHRLHLLRHAKSDRTDAVEDRERPLNRRGREAARRVGASLLTAVGRLDLVLCSPALRTRETAELTLVGCSPRPEIVYDDALYLAGRTALQRRLQQLDEAVGSVLVIGHNPGLHELALELAEPASPSYAKLAEGKFPTGVRASFTVEGAWRDLGSPKPVLTDYVTAKSLGAQD
jgi:phosphohistidine phosphatase